MTNKNKKKTGNKELKQAQEKIEDLTQAAKRSMADLQNYRRRVEEEKREFAKFASVNVFMEILPIFDSLERAQEHLPKDLKDNNWVQGIQNIIKQFEQIIIKFQIEKMKTVGKKFDPNKHEAVAQGAGEKDIIINELEAGYEMDGHTLRAAKVQVGDGTNKK
ncbi:nucleotide exchange factor GrpE [bacterium]|nr:nucleotide exchange factor GrpE [bacterium]